MEFDKKEKIIIFGNSLLKGIFSVAAIKKLKWMLLQFQQQKRYGAFYKKEKNR